MSRRKLVVAVGLVVLLGGTLVAGVVLLDGNSPVSSPEASGESDTPGEGETDEDRDGGVSNPDEQAGETDGEKSVRNGDGSSDPDDDGPAGGNETASMPVHIEAADRGPLESGELRLWNTTSEELVTTYNLSDGHEHTFEGLTPRTTYDLVVNVSFYPDETITFNPRVSESVNETIGYEFQGADSYVIDWVVEELPSNVEYDDEDAEEKAFTTRGTSKLGPEGNFYIGWHRPGYDDTYDHLWIESNQQAYTDTLSRGTDWEKTDRNYSSRVLQREIIVEKGLQHISQREFIDHTAPDSPNNDKLDIYKLPNTDSLDPMIVHVDPQTGYVMYSEVVIGQLEEPTAVESYAQYHSHGKAVNPIPENFPLENLP